MPYILFSPKGITVRTGKCPTSFHFISSLGRTFRWFLLLAVFYSDFTEWKEISKVEQQSPHISVFPVRSSLKSAFVLWWMQSCPCDGPWLGARRAARWPLARLCPTWTSKGTGLGRCLVCERGFVLGQDHPEGYPQLPLYLVSLLVRHFNQSESHHWSDSGDLILSVFYAECPNFTF